MRCFKRDLGCVAFGTFIDTSLIEMNLFVDGLISINSEYDSLNNIVQGETASAERMGFRVGEVEYGRESVVAWRCEEELGSDYGDESLDLVLCV